MNTRFSLLARSSLVMTGITLALASACGSNTSTKVEGSSGSGGAGGSGAGHGGTSGSTAKGGASGHAGSLGANAGESQGGAAGELGAAGMSTGGTNAGAGGAPETSGAGGDSGAGEAGAGGAATGCADGTECDPGFACVATACVPVAAALTGLRWQLPCTAAHGSVNCACPATDSHSAQLTGKTGVSYNVTLHFRGIVEQKTYSGGTTGQATGSSNPNLFIAGGTPASDTWNIYRLDVSSPAQTFYLNAGSSGTDQVWLLDYRATVVMAAGATVTLKADSVESVETFNRNASGTAVVVPSVPPAPDSYDGQFVQVDVESVTAI